MQTVLPDRVWPSQESLNRIHMDVFSVEHDYYTQPTDIPESNKNNSCRGSGLFLGCVISSCICLGLAIFTAWTIFEICTWKKATEDYSRSDLWKNTDEIPGNGIDDDNDGYIDDGKWDNGGSSLTYFTL